MSSMANQQSSTKTVHAVKPPFSDPYWPAVSPLLESNILELLLPLLSPIGKYRNECVAVSKGQGRKKSLASTNGTQSSSLREPDILRYLTVGFNSTVRNLESLAQKTRVASPLSRDEIALPSHTLSAVFVSVADLPDIMVSPLSLLVAIASLRCSTDEAIRLVPITTDSAKKISQAFHQPRASIIGIMKEAPGFEKLDQLLKAQVTPVDVPWIRETAGEKYLPVKIHSEVVKVNRRSSDLKRKRDMD